MYPDNPANTRPYPGGGREGYGEIARGQGYPGYGTQYSGNNGGYPGDFKDTMEKPWATEGWGRPPGRMATGSLDLGSRVSSLVAASERWMVAFS